ncbi:MAG: ABC transporter permease [Bacteroidota bacterium]
MRRLNLLWEGIRIGISSLLAHRLRTLLTTLSVAIGIFAITIIFTLVNSLNYTINRNLSELGNTTLFVLHVPWTNEAMNWQKYYKRPKVSYREFLRLKKNLDHVDGVAYDVDLRRQSLKYGKGSISGVSTHAVTSDFMFLSSFEFGAGRPFTEIEVDAGRPVCVIGSNVEKELFGEGINAIGKFLRVRGKKLKVVGVIDQSGAGVFGSGPDDQIFLPYATASRIFRMNSPSIERFIRVQVSSQKWMAQVESDIVGLMRAERGLRPKVENDFEINRPEMLMNLFSDATGYLQIGGIVISLFSIIVGGFGIGNIMFSTVKERTFEIGLQKALGAPKGFILFQFLMESVLLCLVGGIIGLGLNFGLTALMQAVINRMEIDFVMVVSTESILTGLVLSIMIGLTSGYIPSSIAARMEPIESMRR